MPHTALSSPPRRVSKANPSRDQLYTDVLQLYDYLADIYSAVVKEARLLDPAFAPIDIVELTLSDDESEASYTFATARTDTDYTVVVQAKSVVDSGDLLGAAAFTIRTKTLETAGFTVAFCDSPGDGNAITFEAFIYAL